MANRKEEQYNSVWADQGINDIPTLLSTALNVGRKTGTGFFADLAKKYDDKIKMKIASNIESNPILKRYYMPEKSTTISDADIKTAKKRGEKAYTKQTQAADSFQHKFFNVGKNGTPELKTPQQMFAKFTSGDGKNELTPNKKADLMTGAPEQLAEMHRNANETSTKTNRTVIEMVKEKRLQEETPVKRLNKLDKMLNRKVEDIRRAKERAVTMIAEPLAAIGDTTSEMGKYINWGRSYRRG